MWFRLRRGNCVNYYGCLLVAIGFLKAKCRQAQICFVLSVVGVFIGGSADGGRDEKILDC
jgi:hypothetical protein